MTRQDFTGTLTARDQKTHVVHEVVLPRGAGELTVELAFPRGPGHGNMLCLSLFDAAGFRGSGHRDGTTSPGLPFGRGRDAGIRRRSGAGRDPDDRHPRAPRHGGSAVPVPTRGGVGRTAARGSGAGTAPARARAGGDSGTGLAPRRPPRAHRALRRRVGRARIPVLRPGGGVRLRRPHRPQHDVPARGHRRCRGREAACHPRDGAHDLQRPRRQPRHARVDRLGGAAPGRDERDRAGRAAAGRPLRDRPPRVDRRPGLLRLRLAFPRHDARPGLRRGGVERALGLQQQQRAGPRPLVRVARRGASRRRDRGIGHARPRRGLGAGRPQRGVVAGLHRGGDPRRDRGRSPVRELRTVARAVGRRRRPGRHDGGHPRGGIRRARGALGWLPVGLVPAPGGGRRRAGRGAGRGRRDTALGREAARWFTAEVRDRAGGLLAVTNPVRIEPAGAAP